MENFDINTLDIKTLRLLLAIAQTGSVSGGAEKRGMTQSTASYGLEKLRIAFRDPLFIRAGRGVMPTERGQEILEECRILLGRLDHLASANHFDPEADRRTFVIAATGLAVDVILVPLHRRLSHLAPAARLAVRGMDLKHLVERLETEWDIAVSATVEASPHLKRRRLFEDRFVTYYDPGHRAPPASLEEFCAAPHAVATLGGTASSVVDPALLKKGLRRNVALEVTSFEMLPSLMRRSAMISTLPVRLAERLMKDFASVPCPLDLAPLTIHAVWHARKHTEAGHRWLREQLGQAAAAIPPLPDDSPQFSP